MGVSGSGKSAVASESGASTARAFLDGDFLIRAAISSKMASGEPPLNDDDMHTQWLQALNDAAFAMQRTNKVSLICPLRVERAIATSVRKVTRTFLYLSER